MYIANKPPLDRNQADTTETAKASIFLISCLYFKVYFFYQVGGGETF